jgi:hypothetical protein
VQAASKVFLSHADFYIQIQHVLLHFEGHSSAYFCGIAANYHMRSTADSECETADCQSGWKKSATESAAFAS